MQYILSISLRSQNLNIKSVTGLRSQYCFCLAYVADNLQKIVEDCYLTDIVYFVPSHVKKCLWAYADSQGPDQPVHSCESLDTTEYMDGEQSSG